MDADVLSEKSTVFLNLNSFGVKLIKKKGKYSPHGAFWGILLWLFVLSKFHCCYA